MSGNENPKHSPFKQALSGGAMELIQHTYGLVRTGRSIVFVLISIAALTVFAAGDIVHSAASNFPGDDSTWASAEEENSSMEPSTLMVFPAHDNLKADGESTTKIHAQLKNASGEALFLEDGVVCFRTTGGSLSGEQGDCPTWYVESDEQGNGTYVTTLTSEKSTGTVTITAWFSHGVANTTTVEFRPGDPVALSMFGARWNVPVGQNISITVSIQDAHRNLVKNASHEITLAIENAPGFPEFESTRIQQAKNGTAVFKNIGFDEFGMYLLTASAEGLSPDTHRVRQSSTPSSGPWIPGFEASLLLLALVAIALSQARRRI